MFSPKRIMLHITFLIKQGFLRLLYCSSGGYTDSAASVAGEGDDRADAPRTRCSASESGSSTRRMERRCNRVSSPTSLRLP